MDSKTMVFAGKDWKAAIEQLFEIAQNFGGHNAATLRWNELVEAWVIVL